MTAWLSPAQWESVQLTLDVSTRAVLLAFPVAVAASWLLTRPRLPGRPLLDALVHLPLVLPPVVTGWLLLVVFGMEGPVGGLLWRWFGMRLAFTTNGASLACAVMILPLMVRAIRLSMEAVDPGLMAAAAGLGASPLDRFATVLLPLAAPGLLAALVSGYATSLGEFGAVITFAADIPGQTRTLPLAIFAALQVPGGEAQAARLAAVSLVLALAGLLLAGLLARRLGRLLGTRD
ncbi:molybdate ABC transporter permease subunit [Lichenicoccus sp.]|uniref:molybdate ABC transporter permease subunit n=1 Tax=Lichenicoccus sp. TaxID=2781899 RepID=UPI003D0C01F5